MTDPVFTVGGFWRFAESGMFDSLDDVGALFSQGIERAKAILRESGFREADFSTGTQHLRLRVERGSLDDMAIVLLASGYLGKTMLWHCNEELAPNSAAISDLALHSARFGINYAVVLSMAEGLTKAAATGAAVLAGGNNSGPGRKAQAERDQADTWAGKALEIARALRASDPSAKKADIIRALRRHPDAGRPRLLLPGDRAITAFLKGQGF